MDTEIEKTMGILTDLLHARAYDENYPTDSDLEEAIKELREIVARVKAKDEEIEKLKSIIEEAIRKPMGVEPNSWSDYKMQKDKVC